MQKISVVVPVYHVAPYLDKCVTSILSQTYPNIELILVDDGGDDECPAICDRYAAQDDRVLCIHKENGGQSFARKDGVASATGEYFLFVDADDWLEPETVEKSLRAAQQYDADVVCFGYKRIYENNVFDTPVFPDGGCQIWEADRIPELRRRIIGLVGQELANVEAADRMAPMWGKLYRRSVVEAGNFVSEREVGSSEDALFNLYALSRCQRFVYIDEFLYCYRKTNEQATTRRYRRDLVEKWERLFAYFRQYISENGNDSACEAALKNRIALSALGIGLNELGNPDGFWAKAKNLRAVLNRPDRREAYAKLEMRYFPFKWKVFFLLCKYRQTELLILMLYSINYLKRLIS